jgi:hypothetical protein
MEVKIKSFLCLIKHHVMKTYDGVAVYIHAFFTSKMETKLNNSTLRTLYVQVKISRHPLDKRVVGLRSSLYVVENRKISCRLWKSNTG